MDVSDAVAARISIRAFKPDPVAGDLVAKEVEEGTIRLVLARPVSRMRVFGLKVLAGVIHTFVLMTFIGATGLLAGVLYRRGLGNLVDLPQA